jgi:hypothetical protein
VHVTLRKPNEWIDKLRRRGLPRVLEGQSATSFTPVPVVEEPQAAIQP